ncbi:hypothetical protein NDU88_003834 [Pleurodeles waltl]|uniref:Ig-like domain-containing protein n=1 Tax=Pleurodeles waltl TaxID=8319 RepID=A0AAV7QG01_PLEWA|nr:hypothetical protein NDU88_003834 [Pleurodeles waltl]
MIFSLILFVSPGVLSQVSLQESGPAVVRPSESAGLTCKVSGVSITDSSACYSIEWVRQLPGKGLEWLARIIHNGDKYYAQSLQSKLAISRDTAKNEVYLQMREVKAEDTGRYYCARDTVRQA